MSVRLPRRWFVRSRELWNEIFRLRRAFANFASVIGHAALGAYPFRGQTRSGSTVLITDPIHLYHVSSYAALGWNYDFLLDTVEVPDSVFGKPLFFRGAGHNGDLVGLAGGELEGLNVRNRTVLDIGTNFGDSAIYFAVRGARRVIGIEPYPRVLSLARENVKLNGYESVVELSLCGLAGTSGTAVLDPERQSTGTSGLDTVQSGNPVTLRTLQALISEFNIEDGSVLKIDCEGCEYDAIKFATDNSLRRFRQILIEYHCGVQGLDRRLESASFAVARSHARYATHREYGLLDVGLIHADLSERG